MKQQEYSIGQVLFILSQKYNKVIPVKVTQHIISKTADGESSKYIVSPYFNKNKSYNLEQLAGTVMFSTKEVYDLMLTRASQAIEKIIGESVENAKLLGYNENPELFINKVQAQEKQLHVQKENVDIQEENVVNEITDEKPVQDVPETITLPDGTVAKVNLK
jgi:hypothetical protein